MTSNSLLHTLVDVQQAIATHDTFRQLKPKFFKPNQSGHVIKALEPFDTIYTDLVGPEFSSFKSRNVYLRTLIVKFNQYPFAFNIRDITAKTIIR